MAVVISVIIFLEYKLSASFLDNRTPAIHKDISNIINTKQISIN